MSNKKIVNLKKNVGETVSRYGNIRSKIRRVLWVRSLGVTKSAHWLSYDVKIRVMRRIEGYGDQNQWGYNNAIDH